MIDQAHKLRALVGEAGPLADADSAALRMVVVAGSRTAVGVTTVALNLAAALADRGDRVLLVDGALHANDVRDLAGIRRDVQHGWSDALAGKCAITDALVAGPIGVQMLLARGRTSPQLDAAARRDASTIRDFSRGTQQRCIRALQSLRDAFDLIIVDAGHGNSPWMQQFWSQASLVLLVATPENQAVLDCYATIKQQSAADVAPPLRLLVNLAESDRVAQRTHERIANACHQFLSRSLPALPALPRHRAGDFLDLHAPPRVWEMPNSPFGHAALWLARAVSELLAEDVAGHHVNARYAPPASHFCVPQLPLLS